MEMTTYEAIMVMLATLTLMVSIISIVIKLLLYIIENNAKK
ncbi:MAG: putative holin-like toxin [Bacillota bacterium]|nr:putative holin-like toxin [Bacillota bacterium]